LWWREDLVANLKPENQREALLMLQASAQTAQTMLTCLEVAPVRATELCHLLISNYNNAKGDEPKAAAPNDRLS
jgi:hypothetical protein